MSNSESADEAIIWKGNRMTVYRNSFNEILVNRDDSDDFVRISPRPGGLDVIYGTTDTVADLTPKT